MMIAFRSFLTATLSCLVIERRNPRVGFPQKLCSIHSFALKDSGAGISCGVILVWRTARGWRKFGFFVWPVGQKVLVFFVTYLGF